MRGWAVLLLIVLCIAAISAPARAAHKPFYKSSIDDLAPGTWEAHFVWLRSDYFNYMGEVWWQVSVNGSGVVDILFLDLESFYSFRDGGPYRTLLSPLESVSSGSQYISQLTSDLPYFLILRNPGNTMVQANWTIFAEVDWRRWQGEPPGPTINLTWGQSSPLLGQGGSWETTFTKPETYIYHCEPHFDMTAILEVIQANATPSRVEVKIYGMGFHPEVLRVPVGTTVNWTNLDSMEHSVHLGILEGGFIMPERPWQLEWWWSLLVVPAAIGALLVFRRRRRKAEGTSKPALESRTEVWSRNKHK